MANDDITSSNDGWESVPQNDEQGWETEPSGQPSAAPPTKSTYTISDEGMRSFGLRTKLGFAEGPQEKLDILRANGVDATIINGELRYFDPKEQKLNSIDEASFTLGDVADIIGEIPEFIGSAVGGTAGFIAGARGGPSQAIAGGSMGASEGAMLGRKVKMDIARSLGANISPDEETSRVAESGAYGLVGDPGGRVVGRIVERLAAPAASNLVKGFAEAQATLGKYKDARGRPLHITPGQGQTGALIQAGENISRSSFLGSQSLRSLDDMQEAALEQEVRSLAEGISKGAYSKEEYGTIVQDAIEKKGGTFRAVERRVWGEVDKLSPDKLNVDVAPIRKWAQDILAKTAQAREVAPSISGKKGSTHAVDILADMSSLPDKVSFTTAHEWISQLSAKTRGGPNEVLNSKEIGQLKDLTRLLNVSVETAGKTLQGKEIVDAYNVARQFTSKWRTTFDNKLVASLVNADPQKVADIAFRPNNIESLREAKKAMGPAAFEKIKGAWIGNLFKPDGELALSGDSIARRLAKYDDDTLREILDKPGQLRDVVGLAKTVEIVKNNPRGFGSVAIQLTQPGAMLKLAHSGMAIQGAGATVGAVSHGPAGLATASFLVFGPVAFGKIASSPGGAKWLTEGFKVQEGTKEAARVTSQLMALAYRGDRSEEPNDIKIVSEQEANRLLANQTKITRNKQALEKRKESIPLTQEEEMQLNRDFPGATRMSYKDLERIERSIYYK